MTRDNGQGTRDEGQVWDQGSGIRDQAGNDIPLWRGQGEDVTSIQPDFPK